jgi:hypothetical protein
MLLTSSQQSGIERKSEFPEVVTLLTFRLQSKQPHSHGHRMLKRH